MTREFIKVYGVSPEVRAQLQEAAMRLYGQPNASLLVRSLIASHLVKPSVVRQAKQLDLTGDMIRVELRLPKATVDSISELAEKHFSTRNYYINALIFSHLGSPQLQNDEVEVLRRSNYELVKIGTNLNQVAKAFNELLLNRGEGKMPEIGKKLASLRKEIVEHTGRVLRILKSKTVVLENTGKGRGQKSPKSKLPKG